VAERRGASGPGERSLRRAAGQGIVEFGAILGLAAGVAVVVLVLFSSQLAFILSLVGAEVERFSRVLGAPGIV
jgi:hypothetical protein